MGGGFNHEICGIFFCGNFLHVDKTKKINSKLRNRFCVKSVEAILQIMYGLTLQQISCVNFISTADMLRNFNAKGSTGNQTEGEDGDDSQEIVSFDLEATE